MATIPQSEYRRLRTLEGMEHQLQVLPVSQLTGEWHGYGAASVVRTASPDRLVDIARTHGRTQAYSPDVDIPLEETPTGTGSVYDAVLCELIRRYERALGVALRQRDAPDNITPVEV